MSKLIIEWTELFGRVRQFDMRKAFNLKKDGKLSQFMKLVKEELAECIVEGGVFVINLDDSPHIKYDEKYEPSFYEFFNASSFPMQILSYNEIKSPECYNRILKDTKFYKKDAKMNRNFYVDSANKIIFWTGFKIEDGVDRATQRRNVEERFSVNFNIPEMDVCILKLDRLEDSLGPNIPLDKSYTYQQYSMAGDISPDASGYRMDHTGSHQ